MCDSSTDRPFLAASFFEPSTLIRRKLHQESELRRYLRTRAHTGPRKDYLSKWYSSPDLLMTACRAVRAFSTIMRITHCKLDLYYVGDSIITAKLRWRFHGTWVSEIFQSRSVCEAVDLAARAALEQLGIFLPAEYKLAWRGHKPR